MSILFAFSIPLPTPNIKIAIQAARSGPIDAFGMICEKKGKRQLGEALGMIL